MWIEAVSTVIACRLTIWKLLFIHIVVISTDKNANKMCWVLTHRGTLRFDFWRRFHKFQVMSLLLLSWSLHAWLLPVNLSRLIPMLVRLKQRWWRVHIQEFVYAPPQNQVKWILREAGTQFHLEIDTEIATCQQVFPNTFCSCLSIQLCASGTMESTSSDVW